MNTIQYISTTHRSKTEAEKNKRKVNYLHNLYLKKDASFEEITLLHGNGSTIGRVGDTTDYLALDIDKTNVPISRVEEHFKGNPDYHISFSSSVEPKEEHSLVTKYHIFVNLNRTISKDEYKAEVEKEFDNIKSQICVKENDDMMLDENATNFYQCFFGSSSVISEEVILEGSKRLWSWVKMDTPPNYYERKEYPSLNTAEYCIRHNLLTIKENKRFDLYLPHMTNGKMRKIGEGNRFSRVRVIGTKLLMRIFYLNHDFDEGWTKEDFLNTFEWIVRKNVDMCGSFTRDFKSITRFLDEQWDRLKNIPYGEQCRQLEPYFKDSSKRQYRSRKYKPQKMEELIMENQIDAENVLFLNKEELKSICNERMLNHYEFVKYATSLGLKVVYEEITDKRVKHNVEGMSLDEFNQYCKDNGMSRQMKSKLKKKL